jgi:uncharacterized SAM-binding protein YcdF (DUF218 family)
VSRSLTARSLAIDLGMLLLAGVVGVGAITVYGAARVWDAGRRDEDRSAGAIVVLGAAQYDGVPSPVFRARLDHGIALWRAGRAPLMVVTGGKQEGDRTTEAAAARRYAESAGVPTVAIIDDPESRTTEESIGRVSGLMREHGIDSALFVSDPTHMLRIMRLARDHGIRAFASPTRSSPIEADLGRRVDATVHELGALAWYFLRGERGRL